LDELEGALNIVRDIGFTHSAAVKLIKDVCVVELGAQGRRFVDHNARLALEVVNDGMGLGAKLEYGGV